MQADREGIGSALGKVASGCSILTVQHAGRETGVLVSWVQQASFDPPAISVCLKRGRPAADLIHGAQRFLLNILSDPPTAMFRHFARGFSLDEDAFAGLVTERDDFGRVIRESAAWLGCQVAQVVPVGDHDLYVAEVLAGRTAAERSPYVHLRRSGFSY